MSGWGRGSGNYIPTFDQKITRLLDRIYEKLEELQKTLSIMEKNEQELKEALKQVYEQSRKNNETIKRS